MNIKNSNWIYGTKYRGIPTFDLAKLLLKQNISYENFTFIDIGSGKGRAVLLASALPFKKIIGVEISKNLTSIAKKNICIFPDEEKKCKKIELMCKDAIEYNLPMEQIVLFLFNPFGEPIMRQFVENVRESFHNQPRRVIVIYFNPIHADLWNNIEFLVSVKSKAELCVYDTNRDVV